MAKSEKVKIIGKKIYLKQLNKKNATQEYCDWLNDSEVNKYLETRKTTAEELRRYIKEKNNNKNCLFLGVFYKDNNEHIGNIKLEPIDFKNKKATVGILVGNKKYWGKGIGTEATRIFVDYAFNKLGLKEINLGVISENIVAIRVYEKVGFKVVSIEKRAICHEDELFDKVVMAIKNYE